MAKHALIVHPDAEAFHVYRDVLQEEDMRAQWVKDGLGACEYVQANGDIGLVVVELSLTGVDGFRVLKTLAQTGNAGTPVLVVSAFHALLLSAFRQRRELGIHRLLRTPAPDDAVRPVLRRLLRHEASTAEMPKWTASGAAEAKRLRSLERIGAREPNAQMDRALQLVVDRVARDLGVPIAALSLVLEDRQWFRVRAGTELEETPLDQSFCRHVVQANESLVVADATVHPTFADNTLVRHRLVRGYAGAPLVAARGASSAPAPAAGHRRQRVGLAAAHGATRVARVLRVHSSMPVAFLLAMSLLASFTIAPRDSTAVLDGWRDTKRPLLLFAPTDKDTKLVSELQRLEAAQKEWRDRDVVVAVCIGDYPALRARLGVPPQHFVAVLVGKDGGEKYRTEDVFAVDEITRRIDSMPMGKQEAEARARRPR